MLVQGLMIVAAARCHAPHLPGDARLPFTAQAAGIPNASWHRRPDGRAERDRSRRGDISVAAGGGSSRVRAARVPRRGHPVRYSCCPPPGCWACRFRMIISNHEPLTCGVLVREQCGPAGVPDDHEQSGNVPAGRVRPAKADAATARGGSYRKLPVVFPSQATSDGDDYHET